MQSNGRVANGRGIIGRVAVLIVISWVGMGGAAIGFTQPPPTAAQEGFVPVAEGEPQEQLPAAPLVIAAYAIAWIAVVGYLWFIWQRLGKVEREMAEVSRRIADGARR